MSCYVMSSPGRGLTWIRHSVHYIIPPCVCVLVWCMYCKALTNCATSLGGLRHSQSQLQSQSASASLSACVSAQLQSFGNSMWGFETEKRNMRNREKG
ncbi:hypothetical protein EJ05DRAFT_8528 [Pseudovirgaria hyperparasitica]|uniref:Uncharacterized protein n=1 Tax=Pseudovirgaria hyperparasitica TaxID=470096 RepID=A0A6A6WKX3_9PEZI|nr:uncharacterized protein EJ05DRAFT_8528 [Pseudovirgaria hyperparasitica]KAF2762659.1 hypothetical protein EJ05DRAFT_8528 [Pseudovirgaria hyperparasitica]